MSAALDIIPDLPKSGSPDLFVRFATKYAIPCRDDPWLWMQTAYPWGKKGTVLEGKRPHPWHKEVMCHIRDELHAMDSGKKPMAPIMIAGKSGHGTGKTALMAILNDWNVSTMADARGITSANTMDQIMEKTWPELQKWHRMSISEPLFTWTAKSLRYKFGTRGKNWGCTATPWSENNPDAFAGLHNAKKRVLILFDESSGIPEIIYQTIMGAMTDEDTQIIWVVFGNPLRSSGPFYGCFHKYRKMWWTFTLDSRDVPGTNLKLFEEWRKLYGEESDFFKCRVKGEFPNQSSVQFISRPSVEASMARKAHCLFDDPLVCGIDLARQGLCNSVMYWRKGRDGRTFPPDIYPDDPNSEDFIAKCVGRIADMEPDIILGDAVGVGGPILDRIEGLGWNVIQVQAGGSAIEKDRHANRRAEMWFRGKQWIMQGGALWHDEGFIDELCMIELIPGEGKTRLEPKENLLKRGERSPDIADAFMLTFAYDYTDLASADAQQHAPNREAEQAFDQWADLAVLEETVEEFNPAKAHRRKQKVYTKNRRMHIREEAASSDSIQTFDQWEK